MINVILCGGSGTRLWPLSRSNLVDTEDVLLICKRGSSQKVKDLLEKYPELYGR